MNRHFPFLILFLSITGVLQAQSPWVRGKASFYAQAAWQSIPTYSTIFDQNAEGNKRTLEREISENTLQLYGEYGITRKTTVVIAIPYRFMRSGGVVGAGQPLLKSGNLNGLGNTTLAVRHNFHSENIAFSGQLRIDFPGIRESQATGLRTGFPALTFLPTLSIGQGYGRAYWFAYGGWGGRGDISNHFVNSGLEAGLRFRKHWLIAFSDLWWSTGKAYADSDTYLKTGLFLPDQSYWSFGLKGVFALNRFYGGVLTAAGAFDGDLVPSQPAFAAGIYFRWD